MAKKLTVFNRQAVYLGHDGEQAQLAMDKLMESGILYRSKTQGMRNPVLSNQSVSRKPQASVSAQQYIIYVHQDDFNKAKHVLRGVE